MYNFYNLKSIYVTRFMCKTRLGCALCNYWIHNDRHRFLRAPRHCCNKKLLMHYFSSMRPYIETIFWIYFEEEFSRQSRFYNKWPSCLNLRQLGHVPCNLKTCLPRKIIFKVNPEDGLNIQPHTTETMLQELLVATMGRDPQEPGTKRQALF